MKVMKPNIVMIAIDHAIATATAALGLVCVRRAWISPSTDVAAIASMSTHTRMDCRWPVVRSVVGASPRP